MTKREKILLQICIVIGLVGVCFVYVLMPAMKKSESLVKELESVQADEIRIMSTVQLTGLDERLESEKERANANYEFFYSKLNSYTIDDILNGLAEKNHLEVRSLNIGKYTQRKDSEVLGAVQEPEETEQEEVYDGPKIPTLSDEEDEEVKEEKKEDAVDKDIEQYLLGAESSLSLVGKYSDVMQFISELNRESDCIVINNVSLTLNERAETENTSVNANISVTLYGIDNTFLVNME